MVRFRERLYIANVKTNNSDISGTNFILNPSEPYFRRIYEVGKHYEQFWIHGISFEFVSSSTADNIGTEVDAFGNVITKFSALPNIIFGFQDNAAEYAKVYESKAELLSLEAAAIIPCDKDFVFKVPLRPAYKSYFTVSVNTDINRNVDIKTLCPGVVPIYVVRNGAPADMVLGDLYINVDMSLTKYKTSDYVNVAPPPTTGPDLSLDGDLTVIGTADVNGLLSTKSGINNTGLMSTTTLASSGTAVVSGLLSTKAGIVNTGLITTTTLSSTGNISTAAQMKARSVYCEQGLQALQVTSDSFRVVDHAVPSENNFSVDTNGQLVALSVECDILKCITTWGHAVKAYIVDGTADLVPAETTTIVTTYATREYVNFPLSHTFHVNGNFGNNSISTEVLSITLGAYFQPAVDEFVAYVKVYKYDDTPYLDNYCPIREYAHPSREKGFAATSLVFLKSGEYFSVVFHYKGSVLLTPLFTLSVVYLSS